MLKYLNAVQDDPVRGFLFFLPDNSTETPPTDDSTTWNLGDDGQWKNDYRFPVYAIPGSGGDILMRASAQYSGNMTDVPHGHALTEVYDSRDYVRLFADVNTSGGTTLPSLWVFLLVVLGILLAVIGSTSLIMHILQRRRRQTLRRRVANGEVDLEALGIKRLTVPQEILDEMPLYTYGSGVPVQASARSVARESNVLGKEETSAAESDYVPRAGPISISTLHQPTCAICLDDFIPGTTPSASPTSSTTTSGTIVRELPCRHIFHPECVDAFLRDNSSLCPMCKKTALPKGYCPRVVTNAMVRRERMVRRIRPRVSASEVDAEVERAIAAEDRRGSIPYSITAARGNHGMNGIVVARGSMTWPSGYGRAGTVGTGTRRSIRDANAYGRHGTASEMAELPSSAVTPPSTVVMTGSLPRRDTDAAIAAEPPSNPRRREWARQRALAMLGRDRPPVDPDAEEEARTPRWRKALRSVFPRAR